MDSFIIKKGKINDWRILMEIYSLVSVLLKVKTKEDLKKLLYAWPDEDTQPYLDRFLEKSMEKLRSFSPDKVFYWELTYDFYGSQEPAVLLGFNIGYSTDADEVEFNKELKKLGENPMSVNWPCHIFCEVVIPELAKRKIEY